MLERALDAEGRGHWLWVTAEETRNLSLAGLGPSLADAARWLHQPAEARSSLLEAAPPLPAAGRGRRSLPGRPGKILCLGRNFAAHAREMGSEPSLEDMLWFAKFAESCIPHEAELAVPNWLAGRIDPEAELVLLLGAPLQDATPAQAEQAIAAWTLGNDFTAGNTPSLKAKELAGFRIAEFLAAAEDAHIVSRLLTTGVNPITRAGNNPAVLAFQHVRRAIECLNVNNTRVGQETADRIQGNRGNRRIDGLGTHFW